MVGSTVGRLVGLFVGVRLTIGALEGKKEGEKEGPEGRAVGVGVGAVGRTEGSLLGWSFSSTVGAALGAYWAPLTSPPNATNRSCILP
jgi:uncharacterized membrane protein